METSAVIIMLFVLGTATVAFWIGYFFSSLFGGFERGDEILREELIQRLTKRAVDAEDALKEINTETEAADKLEYFG